jgi:ribosomal protein L11 methyltransferase
MKKFYYLLEVSYSKNNNELIYNTLYCSGIKKILEEYGIIKVFFGQSEANILESLKLKLITLPLLSKKSIVISKIEDINWNKEWMRSIKPIYIKSRIAIVPTWKKSSLRSRKNMIIIIIDPKMSFGTGHSESTQLILGLMCKYTDKDDQLLLDYGCGAGILAIAGIKLGIKKSVAIDIDPDAIENAKESFRKNRVHGKIALYKSDIKNIREKNFDIICANIDYNTISKRLKTIKAKLKNNGKLFISGILAEEKENILNSLKKFSFVPKKISEKAEWIALYCIQK